jgi:hypothetical protein
MVNGDDRSAWVIGGVTLIGVGVGLIFLSTSALWFVASVLIGIGSGLVIASLIKKDNDGKTGGINGQRALREWR